MNSDSFWSYLISTFVIGLCPVREPDSAALVFSQWPYLMLLRVELYLSQCLEIHLILSIIIESTVGDMRTAAVATGNQLVTSVHFLAKGATPVTACSISTWFRPLLTSTWFWEYYDVGDVRSTACQEWPLLRSWEAKALDRLADKNKVVNEHTMLKEDIGAGERGSRWFSCFVPGAHLTETPQPLGWPPGVLLPGPGPHSYDNKHRISTGTTMHDMELYFDIRGFGGGVTTPCSGPLIFSLILRVLTDEI